jgi:ketosteroid isomerase-like protein
MHPLDVLADVLRTGDAAPILPLLAEGSVVWHNDDQREVDAMALMQRAGELQQVLDGIDVDVIRRLTSDDCCVEQMVLRGRSRVTGMEVVSHRCIVMLLRDGLVSRIEEYIDPTFAAQVGAGE